MGDVVGLPQRVVETAYRTTPCRSCGTDSGLEIEPPRYVCVGCGETGEVVAGGWQNRVDAKPDRELDRALSKLCAERPSIRAFRTLARKNLKVALRTVPVA